MYYLLPNNFVVRAAGSFAAPRSRAYACVVICEL